LYRSDVPFEWIDTRKIRQCAVFSDGTRLENPHPPNRREARWFRDSLAIRYDVPSTAPVPPAERRGVCGVGSLKTIVVEALGGRRQAASSPKIGELPRVSQGISVAELRRPAREQATRFGAEILLARENVRASFTAGKRTGILSEHEGVSRSAIAHGVEYTAAGRRRRALRGARCTTAPARAKRAGVDDDVVIVGGGNSAAQAARSSRASRGACMSCAARA